MANPNDIIVQHHCTTYRSTAVEEILESPEILKDLDLDAFSLELERQVGFENFHVICPSASLMTGSVGRGVADFFRYFVYRVKFHN